MPSINTRRLALVGAATLTVIAGVAYASDHQDTPFVEANPRYDINDVYAFPSLTPGRIALVLGTSSPLTPAATSSATFGTRDEVLYQLKVDNTGDAREDLVLQFTFTGPAGAQRVRLQGPARPTAIGTANTLLVGAPELQGAVGTSLGSTSGIQLFAGPRDDPFFIDLEQFFRIVPDRKPEGGPLSQLPSTPSATSFRDPANAVDFLKGINDLAIVVELPESLLTENGTRPRFGVWGTVSRARNR